MITVGDIFQEISERLAVPRPHMGMRVISVAIGCTCAWFANTINSINEPGQEHMHITACRADIPVGKERSADLRYYTYSVREDGRMFYTWPCWEEADRTELILIGHAEGVQLPLL